MAANPNPVARAAGLRLIRLLTLGIAVAAALSTGGIWMLMAGSGP
ncbi:MAG TPA: hypothetical protein VHC49_11530 [Mycobacteriales bacterium]|nr:hypothetical protein [Mycobacteriales bacterium]